MSLETIRKEHNLPINYNSIEETENSWIILKNTHLSPMLTFPFKNINIMFGLDKDNYFKIHSLHYPKEFFGKENVLNIAESTVECPYCIVGKKAIIDRQLEEIYLNSKYIDKTIVIENMAEKNYENNGNENLMENIEAQTKLAAKQILGLDSIGVADWVGSVLINESISTIARFTAKNKSHLICGKIFGGAFFALLNPALTWITKGKWAADSKFAKLRTQLSMYGFNQFVGGIGELASTSAKYGTNPLAETFEDLKRAAEGLMSGYGPAEVLAPFISNDVMNIAKGAGFASVQGYEDTEQIKIGFSDPITDERYDGLKIMH